MLTFGDVIEDPTRVAELGEDNLLIAAAEPAEVVIREGGRKRDATMIFVHETIQIMKTERAEQLDKLRAALKESSEILPVRQKAESMWDHITVGRASTADILIDDPAISSVHAHFEVDYQDGSVSLQDVGSSNGTFVNRTQLQPHTPAVLRAGDCVRFGQSVYYYLTPQMLLELVGG